METLDETSSSKSYFILFVLVVAMCYLYSKLYEEPEIEETTGTVTYTNLEDENNKNEYANAPPTYEESMKTGPRK